MATLLLCTAWREIQREKVVATFDSIRAKSNPNCFAVSLCSEYKKIYFNVSRFVVFMKYNAKYIQMIQKHFHRLTYNH